MFQIVGGFPGTAETLQIESEPRECQATQELKDETFCLQSSALKCFGSINIWKKKEKLHMDHTRRILA